MKIGRPEDFFDKQNVRLNLIKRAVAQYQFSAIELKKRFVHKIDGHTSFFLKGFGNEVNLLSAFRELFFNSRELLDLLLIKISDMTNGTKHQTPRSFLPFAKKLMLGEFDYTNLTIIKFLKTNINYIFHIRKIRNEIKNNPANIEFVFNTNRFEARLRVPINKDEIDLIEYLDINNKDQAIKNMSYSCTYYLDEIFPEMLKFWELTFSMLQSDLNQQNNQKSHP